MSEAGLRRAARRIVLGTGAMILATVPPVVAGEKAPARPDIIFLLTDDQRDGTLGALGHPWVQTPHLDRLIRGGVRFRNAYIAEPTCSPSRTAFFTGVHERVNGVGFTSSYRLTDAQWERTYPALLRQHGYHTGFIGKFGVEYYTFRGRAAEKFDYWRAHDGWARFFPKGAPNCRAYEDSEADIITDIDGEGILRFLASAPSDRPYCLSVSFSVPHGSQTTSMHPDRSMRVPANENPRLQGHPVYDALYRDLGIRIPPDTATDPYRFIPRAVMDQDRGRRRTYAYNYETATCLEHHVRYYQQLTGLDRVIGRLMTALERRGSAGNTVILYASDNGLLMGEYGMGGKALLYDLTSRIPCFIHDPRLPESRRGRVDDHLVSSLDLTRTILDCAGVAAPPEMGGRSLLPLMADPDAPWREELFLENLYTGRDTPFGEGIRRGAWKYVRFFDGKAPYDEADVAFGGRAPDFEQLFHLEQDPGERRNRAADPVLKDLLEDLRGACRRQSEALNRQRREYRAAFEPAPRQGTNREPPR